MNNRTEDQGHERCPAWCTGHGAPGHWAMPYEVVLGRLEAAGVAREDLTNVEVVLSQYPGEEAVVTLSGANNAWRGVEPANLLLSAEEAQQLGRALMDAGRTVGGVRRSGDFL